MRTESGEARKTTASLLEKILGVFPLTDFRLVEVVALANGVDLRLETTDVVLVQ